MSTPRLSKIVRIIARLNVGGPAKHVVWLTDGLKDTHETLLVAGTVPSGEGDMSYFAEQLQVVPHIIPEMSREISLQDVVTIWKLYRLFLREQPDVVHTHTAKAGTVGRVAGFIYRWLTLGSVIGRPRKCKFVHTYHGHIFHSYYGNLKTRVFISIEKLLAALNRLVDAGHTVLLIEHHLDVIKTADHVIDLGPEGGHAGGEVVASGTPETIAAAKQSHTGRFLKAHLRA